jgi:hypothetical protein
MTGTRFVRTAVNSTALERIKMSTRGGVNSQT